MATANPGAVAMEAAGRPPQNEDMALFLIRGVSLGDIDGEPRIAVVKSARSASARQAEA